MLRTGSKALDSTLEDEMKTIRASLARIAETAADAAGSRLGAPMAEAERGLTALGGLVDSYLNRGRKQARRAWADASERAESGAGEVADRVARHPMAAIGLAALIGFTLGLAVGRPGSHR
ncbi:hypothetical protein [Prosthecomicrobium sp. N25]|uniref:hypothetical protein n=1 Tax=Prosthecomicrobium sp. N25 TaxID=3129254 RepID=UPI00307717ED